MRSESNPYDPPKDFQEDRVRARRAEAKRCPNCDRTQPFFLHWLFHGPNRCLRCRKQLVLRLPDSMRLVTRVGLGGVLLLSVVLGYYNIFLSIKVTLISLLGLMILDFGLKRRFGRFEVVERI